MNSRDIAKMLLLLLLSVFKAEAVNPGCECILYTATYGKEYGIFSSPDFPKPYPPKIKCLLYTFIAASDEIIEIAFKEFDVDKASKDCLQGDYLKLFLHVEDAEVNEYTSWSNLLCGKYVNVPHMFYSSGPGLVLEFHTDEHHGANSSGFIGTFKFLEKKMFHTDGHKLAGTTCDYQFISTNHTRPQGRFFSPRYPSNYPVDIKCAYTFRARAQEKIRVVLEEIKLEEGDVSCINRADYIKVHDGRTASYPAIGLYCNQASYVEILSTGPELYIEFVSHSVEAGQGFKAKFQFQNEYSMKSTKKIHHYNVGVQTLSASNCDVVFKSDVMKNGSLSSPQYPGSYSPRTTCRYEFQGRGKERVQIKFNDFSLYHPGEETRECEGADVLSAFIMIDGKEEKIDSYCGANLPRPLMSNGPRLVLEFKGIYSSRLSRGFQATYSFTEDFGISTGHQLTELPCAFMYNSSTVHKNGSFTSPNYPGFYPRDTECHYFFYGRGEEKIKLVFEAFDVEGVPPCEARTASDYIEFSNYMARDRKFPRYCGYISPFEVTSDQKFFRLTFRSNDRLDGTGFKASYHFIEESNTLSSSIKPTLSSTSTSTSSYLSVSIVHYLYVLSLVFLLQRIVI